MKAPRKDQNLQPASVVLESLLASGQGPLADQYRRWQLWNRWSEVVGPRWAPQSIPVSYREGVLSVWVPSSAHLQELSFGVDLLKQKVNQFMGTDWVKSIRLTLDRKEVPQVPPSPGTADSNP